MVADYEVMSGSAVDPYVVLLEAFVAGRLSAGEFEMVFLRMYKNDPAEWPSSIFDVLDGLFADVDEYCSDDVLRGEVGGLDEEQLRSRSTAALDRLKTIST